MKKISIVVPFYNSEDVLKYCLDSICCQSIDKSLIEAILVDDASTDSSAEIAKEYAQNHDYFRVITLQENSGQSAARNEGVKSAEGEYVFFADADDWLGKDCLKKLLIYAEQNDTDVVTGRIIMVDRSEKRGRVAWCRGIVREYNKDSFADDWEQYASMGPWSRLIKRDFLRSNEIEFPVDMYMFEDIYWLMQVLHYASSAALINDYDYYFLRRDTGLASLTTNERVITKSIKPENICYAIDKICSLSEEYGYGDDHVVWRRVFSNAAYDGINFITTAANIDPDSYPEGGKYYKQELWKRIERHYSPWVRNNIGSDRVCRYDAMAAGYDYDSENDPLVFFVQRRYERTEAAAEIENCGISITSDALPKYLSKETVTRLAGEQAESYEFFIASSDRDNNCLTGEYCIKLKVCDAFSVEMIVHTEIKSYGIPIKCTPYTWGEKYQEFGEWEAQFDGNLEEVRNITYNIKLEDIIVAAGNVDSWNEEMGRPIVRNPKIELLKDKNKDLKKEIKTIKKELKNTRKELERRNEELESTKEKFINTTNELSKIKGSKSWKIVRSIRKIKRRIKL